MAPIRQKRLRMWPRDPAFLLFGTHPDQTSWRGVALLALVFGGSLLGAAVLAPPVYFGVQALAANSDAEIWDYLARHPFTRYVDRLRWLPVLLALPWLLRQCGLGSTRALGFTGPDAGRRFLGAFLLGVLMLAGLSLAQVVSGQVEARPRVDGPGFLRVLAEALLSGVLIALLEEAIFRGLVLRQFYTALRPWPALLASTAFFALLHFKKIPPSIWGPDEVVTWGSGFYVAAWTVGSVIATFDYVFFLNYLFVGLALGLVFLRTRSLWACVGLHAGWVTVLKLHSFYFVPSATPSGFWGTPRIIDGTASLLLLAALTAALVWTWRRGGKHDSAPPPAGLV